MRTPGQFQQNFPREVAMSEAAALAGADPIQFRIDHAKEERVKSMLQRLREESGWETRHSPHPKAASTGTTPVRGQGVAVMYRKDSYWACACQIAVTPATGAIAVEKVTMVVDPGIVVNPMQLKRQVEGGIVMGISHALYEELTFDARLADVPDSEDGGDPGNQGCAASPAGSGYLRPGIRGGERNRRASHSRSFLRCDR
jgi:CO/xanthine dehydrogenase Mo-binding subunit